MARQSVAQALQIRAGILARAMDIASMEGLEGLTIGRLAEATSMSKSGLFAHFGSKEDLQLAVVDAARQVFERAVFGGAGSLDAGLARLEHLAASWLGYIERGTFRGGCFFAAVSTEVDDRPGRVRDTVVELTRGWLGRLEDEAAHAVDAGHLEATADPAQLAFEIHAFVQEANRAFQLHGETEAFRRAARAVGRSLRVHATSEGLALLEPEP